jgi:hypothetical protein
MGGLESGSNLPEAAQAEFSMRGLAKELSEQEFSERAERVAREYGTTSISTFYQIIREGRGKEVLGTVSERGSETEIALESSTEHMFVNICNANGLPVYVIGEHHSYKSPQHNGIEPKHISYFDALDDTREFEQGGPGQQGLPAPLWTVGSFYNLEGKPIAGVIANMKERKMYINANGKNSLVDLETKEEKEIKPSSRTSIKDKGFCLATYLGDPKYALSFFENFSEVQKALMEANNDAVNQPHTGSFIYGPMAEGNVDAYLIAREPISEQLPGWAFAQTAGFTAWEINPKDGSYQEIKHDFNNFKENPNEYRKGRMSMYLVTRSDQVRDEIISLVVKGYKKKELQRVKDAFIASRPEEFEIFRKTQN